jgi:FAD binding domain/Berberine and berberine like
VHPSRFITRSAAAEISLRSKSVVCTLFLENVVAMTAPSHLTRRALLHGAGASLALPLVLRRASAAPRSNVSKAAWDALAAKITGGVLPPNDPRFRTLTRPENLQYYNPPLTPDGRPDPDAPLGVVLPHNASEVAAAITWARDLGLPMVPRSGGHSYAGCSTIAGLVIHTGAMREVRITGHGAIEVAGGALNSDVFAALKNATSQDAPEGLAITHGRCGTVGVSAYLMGGGIGFSMRDYGLGCDLAESVELVLSDGQVVTASAKDNPDLFWAVRGGGGGNLGLVTRWRLGAVPAEQVVAFDVKWKWRSRGKVEEVFTGLVRALEAAPDRMGAKVNVTATKARSREPNAIDLLGQFRGSLDEFWSILGPALADADSKAVVRLPYWEAQTFLEEQGEPNKYQVTSRYLGKLSDGFISEVFHWCRQWPGTKAQATMTVFLAGGHIGTIPAAATAFVHRSAQWLLESDLGWTDWDSTVDIKRNLAWQRGLHNALRARLEDSGSYQNFPDPALADPAQAYWGANLSRLQDVKRRVGPDDVFHPPRRQGIFP